MKPEKKIEYNINQYHNKSMEKAEMQNTKMQKWVVKNKSMVIKFYLIVIFFTVCADCLSSFDDSVMPVLSAISSIALIFGVILFLPMLTSFVPEAKMVKEKTGKNDEGGVVVEPKLKITVGGKDVDVEKLMSKYKSRAILTPKMQETWTYIKNSKNEWMAKFFVLLFLGVLLWAYFNFK